MAPLETTSASIRDQLLDLERLIGLEMPRERPGVARIKSEPSDFIVEEIGLDGEIRTISPRRTSRQRPLPFVEFTMVKRNISTAGALALLSRRLKIRRSALTVAGLKDVNATTAQAVRLPVDAAQSLSDQDFGAVALHSKSYADRPLTIGALRGNLFRIRVMTDTPAREAIERVKSAPVRNYFDIQRFGRRVNLHTIGRRLVDGDMTGAFEQFLFETSTWEDTRFGVVRAAAIRSWPDLNATKREFSRARVRGGLSQELHILRRAASIGLSRALWDHPMVGPFCVRAWAAYLFNVVVSSKSDDEQSLKLFDGQSGTLGTYAHLSGSEPLRAAEQSAARRYLTSTERWSSVRVDNLAIVDRDGGQEWTFTLPSGAYATTVLRHAYVLDHGHKGERKPQPIGHEVV